VVRWGGSRRNNPATVAKPFFQPCEKLLKRASSKVLSHFNGEVAMNAIVAGVLASEAAKAQAESHPLTLIAMLCGVGLVAALTMASMGFDLGAGFFWVQDRSPVSEEFASYSFLAVAVLGVVLLGAGLVAFAIT
jgi:hypothetical protein